MKEFTETAVPSFSRAQLMTPDKRSLSGSLFPGKFRKTKANITIALALSAIRLRSMIGGELSEILVASGVLVISGKTVA